MTINVAAYHRAYWGFLRGRITAYCNPNALGEPHYGHLAALALASLPPSNRVMNDKPRARGANIISFHRQKASLG